MMRRRMELIVIGASWGGQKALEALVGALPAGLPCPIAVAQHRAATDSPDVAGGLARACALTVRDALDKDALAAGHVYVAPADYHLLVEAAGRWRSRRPRPSIRRARRSTCCSTRRRPPTARPLRGSS